MSIRWEIHIPQAMQRHTGSVKDTAPESSKCNPSKANDAKIPLFPEYGDPIWLPAVQPEPPEDEDELRELS
jgi:hypothetical protein